MVTVLIRVEEKGPTPGVMRREQNAVSKAAWQNVGWYWGEALREKHFTEAGASEYGYRDRTEEYEGAKERAWGHRDPLVWTGESKEESENYRVRSTKDGATVALSMPALNFSNRGHEMKSISDQEARELATVWAGGFDDRLERLKNAKNKTTVK